MSNYDVIIIGAGPAGTACASLLQKQGKKCLILEKSEFPRFTIGESFLPQNMELYKDCGLDHVFSKEKFQYKDGAEFLFGRKWKSIDFKNKSTKGPWSTYQVYRAKFDHVITNTIEEAGVKIEFGVSIDSINLKEKVTVIYKKNGKTSSAHGLFLVDSSGLAKVLPNLLNLKTIYNQPKRLSLFTHMKTNSPTSFDNNKILITVDEQDIRTWFWTIPLEPNRYSIGVITEKVPEKLSNEESLRYFIERNKGLKEALGNFDFLMPIKKIQSYTSKTEKTYGDKYILIGNSGEFLDPIFSSGVTVALKTATLAAPLISKILNKEAVNWELEYILPLQRGIETFKAFVNSWYNGELQKIIFATHIDPTIQSYIISILAGYAWDESNPYTKKSSSRLAALSKIIG